METWASTLTESYQEHKSYAIFISLKITKTAWDYIIQKKGTVIFGVGTECSEIMLTNGAGSQATFSFQFQTLLN